MFIGIHYILVARHGGVLVHEGKKRICFLWFEMTEAKMYKNKNQKQKA